MPRQQVGWLFLLFGIMFLSQDHKKIELSEEYEHVDLETILIKQDAGQVRTPGCG